MRTLKYAILGLVRRSPVTGYDISREFEGKFIQGLASFWNASHSQIYPELKRLTNEGLITFDTVIAGEKLEKKIYTITEKGKEELVNWMLREEELPPTPKEAFRLRLYLSDCLEDEDVVPIISKRLRQVHERLELYTEKMERLYGGKKISELSKIERGDYMVLRQGILRDRMTIQWLDDCAILFVQSKDYVVWEIDSKNDSIDEN